MNKMVKGSVAGAAGIALLMGGFGTYALWQDSADMGAHGITAGELTISTDNSAAVWWDETNDVAWSESNLVVPGDVISRTQTFAITGTGKNLEGTITLGGGVVQSTFGDWLDYDVTVTAQGGTVVKPNLDTADKNDFIFDGPFTTDTLTAVVTYTVGDAKGLDAQKATATMAATTFTIKQS